MNFLFELCGLTLKQKKMKTEKLIMAFIDQVWNNQQFEKSEEFLHPEFKDNSLPSLLTPDKEGMKKWILATSAAFEHKTIIEEQVTEGDKSIVKIRMDLKHIGVWRGIEPTGMEVKAVGFRFYKIAEGKIIEHWGLIDGQAIENQLRDASQGCKIAQ
jgi:predicted ester cyclase